MRYKPTSEQIISAIEYRTGIHPSKDFAETLRCRSEIPSLYIHPWFDRKGCKISMWKLVKYVNYKHERDEQFPKDIGRIFDTIINASKDIFEKFPSKGQTWWDEWATGTYSFNPDILHISYRDATKTRQVLNSELKKQFDIERKEIIKINIEKGHHKGYWILCTTFEEELYNYVVEEAPKAVLDIFTLVDCSLCNTEHPDIDYTNRGYGEIIDRILDKISPFDPNDPYTSQVYGKVDTLHNRILHKIKADRFKNMTKESMLKIISDSFGLTMKETKQYIYFLCDIRDHQKNAERFIYI